MDKTKLWTSLMIMFGGSLVAGSVYSQTTSPEQLERVEVTGSAIRRIDAETALPVTILRVDDLKKEGITTVEAVLQRISASQSTQGTSQSVGLGTGGAAFANLRGLGQNKTLVLLNGRRIANNAIDASAPDLNTIPFAIIDRIEVLRDGASSLYGTDAVGGVINFITKQDFVGGSATLGYDQPEHKGGKAYNGSFTFGGGDLAKDNANIFGAIEYQQQDRIRASERDYAARSLKTSSVTYPGQYNQGGNVQHPLYPDCGAPAGIPLGPGGVGGSQNCGYLYSREVDDVPNTNRMSAYLKGTLQITPTTQGTLEYFATQSRNDTLIAGVPYGALAVNPGTPYYPGNGITPLPTAFTLNPAYTYAGAPDGTLPGAVKVRWRDELGGGRAEQTNNIQQRLVAAIQGSAAGWDYKGGFAFNSNSIEDNITGGYTNGDVITADVLNGIINPFGANNAAGLAAEAGAIDRGQLFTARGRVFSADAQATKELGDWLHAGRPAALAIGTEVRHENFLENGNPPFDQELISSTGFDPATHNAGNRSVYAVYAEFNMPIIKSLDVTAAVRYDKYSDFGSTTNPKGSFRFQPIPQVLIRGSAETGFRAPSLYELHSAQTYTNTANNHDDPVRCPGGVPIAGVSPSDNCGDQFIVLNGGNNTLKPEKSTSYNVGIVLEPVAGATVGVDLFWIRLKQQIGVLDDNTIFSDPVKYAGLFHRAPDGSLSTDGSQCPGANCGFITDTTENLGEVHTSGIDITLAYNLKAGAFGNFVFGSNNTYVTRYDYQNEEGGIFVHNVGTYQGVGPIFRWQSTANVDWTYGAFGVSAVGRYKSGYADQDPSNHVASYTVFDFSGTWTPVKAFSLTIGLKNAFDRLAPYSNQAATFQTGFDPRFADSIGRTYFGRGTYNF